MRTLKNIDKENTNVVFCSFTQENLDTEIGFQIDRVLSIQFALLSLIHCH